MARNEEESEEKGSGGRVRGEESEEKGRGGRVRGEESEKRAQRFIGPVCAIPKAIYRQRQMERQKYQRGEKVLRLGRGSFFLFATTLLMFLLHLLLLACSPACSTYLQGINGQPTLHEIIASSTDDHRGRQPMILPAFCVVGQPSYRSSRPLTSSRSPANENQTQSQRAEESARTVRGEEGRGVLRRTGKHPVPIPQPSNTRRLTSPGDMIGRRLRETAVG